MALEETFEALDSYRLAARVGARADWRNVARVTVVANDIMDGIMERRLR